jgi:hypothetical protein
MRRLTVGAGNLEAHRGGRRRKNRNAISADKPEIYGGLEPKPTKTPEIPPTIAIPACYQAVTSGWRLPAKLQRVEIEPQF